MLSRANQEAPKVVYIIDVLDKYIPHRRPVLFIDEIDLEPDSSTGDISDVNLKLLGLDETDLIHSDGEVVRGEREIQMLKSQLMEEQKALTAPSCWLPLRDVFSNLKLQYDMLNSWRFKEILNKVAKRNSLVADRGLYLLGGRRATYISPKFSEKITEYVRLVGNAPVCSEMPGWHTRTELLKKHHISYNRFSELYAEFFKQSPEDMKASLIKFLRYDQNVFDVRKYYSPEVDSYIAGVLSRGKSDSLPPAKKEVPTPPDGWVKLMDLSTELKQLYNVSDVRKINQLISEFNESNNSSVHLVKYKLGNHKSAYISPELRNFIKGHFDSINSTPQAMGYPGWQMMEALLGKYNIGVRRFRRLLAQFKSEHESAMPDFVKPLKLNKANITRVHYSPEIDEYIERIIKEEEAKGAIRGRKPLRRLSSI